MISNKVNSYMLESNSSGPSDFRQSFPENSFVTNIHPKIQTQSHSVPNIGKSMRNSLQFQPLGLTSTSRISVWDQPETNLSGDLSMQRNLWNEPETHSSNNLIIRSSNWNPIEFPSSSNDFHRTSVWDEAWIHSHNISSNNKSGQYDNLNGNRSYSNGAAMTLNQTNKIEASSPELDNVESDQILATKCINSRRRMICFSIVATCLFISIVLGTVLGILIYIPTGAITSTQTTTTTTSATTTTSTTSTTSETTITTTALVPQSCTVGSPTMLLNLYNPGQFSYTYYNYLYTPTTQQATIMVELEQDPSAMYIDGVSVVDASSQQLLTNGGFETGSLAPWQHGTVSGGGVSSGCGYSGTYCYSDAIVSQTDNIHQTFSSVSGSTVNVSFYLQNNSGGSVIIARVCIYPY
ncbi:unnamed protein product [Rotaria magnacalcarata]|uniref:Uncharacterized protein n=2 Tax=Rotaria magnacalcarata TaxID=392030 RepID=A0A816Z8G8_9BILA|nr:unnamed protein product [Rotaria magnacalcarata]CAF2204645.1 unnamed protein product [Rotaria magnacalcarata]CAF4100672.1 unnamed protein product [Rotaria magnacalcarata]CAF4249629.1 unnamed protein product [Rotaria magnacalcarata]CAF4285373.1 unnamed protein product [Rotaria magnacalcarata]